MEILLKRLQYCILENLLHTLLLYLLYTLLRTYINPLLPDAVKDRELSILATSFSINDVVIKIIIKDDNISRLR